MHSLLLRGARPAARRSTRTPRRRAHMPPPTPLRPTPAQHRSPPHTPTPWQLGQQGVDAEGRVAVRVCAWHPWAAILTVTSACTISKKEKAPLRCPTTSLPLKYGFEKSVHGDPAC